jgi:para-nitrobenzyl esterase
METMLTRRSLISRSLVAAPTLLLPGRGEAIATPTDPVAATEAGKVRGVRSGGVEVYRGIPYAGSVSGMGRFKAPPPPVAWSGIRDAQLPGPPSIQAKAGLYVPGEPPASEDCLTLTIWTPSADAAHRPVMFYSHGGGLIKGSSAGVVQDSANLAREQDVVVVASNHRLGLLGYMFLQDLGGEEYADSGNQGLLDLAAALEWTVRNIAPFGGDPSNIMIFGESGGGAKTACLYAMPSIQHAFNKASIESGPAIRVATPETAIGWRDRVLAELGASKTDWRKLLSVPADVLLAAQLKVTDPTHAPSFSGGRAGMDLSRSGFSPVVDGRVLPTHPFDPTSPLCSRRKPLMVGYNSEEWAMFALVDRDTEAFTLTYATLEQRLAKEMPEGHAEAIRVYRESRPRASPSDIYIAIRTALFAGAGSVAIAERKAAEGAAPAYAYVFDYKLEQLVPGTNHPTGAMHALEIAFKFDNVAATHLPNQPNFAGNRPERFAAGLNMSALWASFARTGTPSAPGVPTWPAYTPDRRATMIVDHRCRVVNDPHDAERRFWEKLGL